LKTLEEKRAVSKWFSDTANWLVLFVQSREEQRVVNYLRPKLDPDRYTAFVPTRDFAFNKGKRNIETQQKPWLRGYVFIVAMVDEVECLNTVKPLISQHPSIYRLQPNGEGTSRLLLSEHDKSVMMSLLDENFNIPAVESLFVGTKVEITDEAFKGKFGKVKYIDKHKRYAIIELELFNTLIKCEVMLDILNAA
jgi:transcriptional antiterminator NusG